MKTSLKLIAGLFSVAGLTVLAAGTGARNLGLVAMGSGMFGIQIGVLAGWALRGIHHRELMAAKARFGGQDLNA